MPAQELTPFVFDGTKKIPDYLTAVTAIDGVKAAFASLARVNLFVDNGGATTPAIVTITAQQKYNDGVLPDALTFSVPFGEAWAIKIPSNYGLLLGDGRFLVEATFDQVDTVSAGFQQ